MPQIPSSELPAGTDPQQEPPMESSPMSQADTFKTTLPSREEFAESPHVIWGQRHTSVAGQDGGVSGLLIFVT